MYIVTIPAVRVGPEPEVWNIFSNNSIVLSHFCLQICCRFTLLVHVTSCTWESLRVILTKDTPCYNVQQKSLYYSTVRTRDPCHSLLLFIAVHCRCLLLIPLLCLPLSLSVIFVLYHNLVSLLSVILICYPYLLSLSVIIICYHYLYSLSLSLSVIFIRYHYLLSLSVFLIHLRYPVSLSATVGRSHSDIFIWCW